MKGLYLLLPVTLLLWGCDSSDSTTEAELCPYYVQKDLDNNNFDKALTRIEDQQCKDAYESQDATNKSYLLAKATAHSGKAGLPMLTIVKSVLPEKEDEEVDFASFVANLSHDQKNDALNQIHLSRQALGDYLQANGNIDCSADATNFTDMQRSVCLNDSFMNVVKATQGIQFLLNNKQDVIDEWGTGKEADGSSKEAPDEMKFSIAAIQSLLGPIDNVTKPGDEKAKLSGFEKATPVNSTVKFDDGNEYKVIKIVKTTVPVSERFYLGSTTTTDVVMTQGTCKTDLILTTPEEEANGTEIYPCPVKIGSEASSSLNEHITKSLNEGIDNVTSLAESANYDTGKSDSEMKDSMVEFKCQITKITSEGDQDKPITALQLTDYMLLTKDERHDQKAKCKI